MGGADPHFASYEPNDADRQKVRENAVFMTDEGLAEWIGISVKTLLKYYHEEIREKRGLANAVAGGKAWQLVQAGDGQMIRYWLSRRAGWREQVEHAGPGGGPIEYSNLSEDEIDARLKALAARHGHEPLAD